MTRSTTSHGLPRRLLSSASRLLPTGLGRRLRRDDDGAVAIEFALISPVLVLLYLGLFQISMVITEARNVSHSASVLGDLVTRSTSLDADGLADTFQGAIEVLSISNTATLAADVEMELTSIIMTDSSTYEVVGYASTGGSWAPIKASSIDPRLLNEDSGAVIARVRYNYRMLSNSTADQQKNIDTTRFIDRDKDGVKLAEQFILNPRDSNGVPFTEGTDNSSYSCPIGTSGAVSCTVSGAAKDRPLG